MKILKSIGTGDDGKHFGGTKVTPNSPQTLINVINQDFKHN